MKKIKNFVLEKIEDLEFKDIILTFVLVLIVILFADLIRGVFSDFVYSETPVVFSLTEEGESLKSLDLSSSNVLHSKATFEKDGEEYERTILSYEEVSEALGYAVFGSEKIEFVSSPEEEGIEIFVGEKYLFSSLELVKEKEKKVVIKVFVSQ